MYVDTSVFGGTADVEFAAASRRFFDRVRAGEFVVVVSQLVADELADAPPEVQQVLRDLPSGAVLEATTTNEATALAQAYIDTGVVGDAVRDDALHVATATVAGVDLILSWNFKHIVNYERIRKYNGVNALRGYREVEIRSPLELANDNKDQDF